MIRTFRLYRLEKLERLSLSQAEERLRAVRLATVAAATRPPLSRLLSDLAKRLTNERLQVVRSLPRRWELSLTGRWPARSLTVAAGPSPVLPVRVSLWLRRTIPWLIVFEANRALSEAAARLVAAALAGEPARVSPIMPDLPHWKALEDWVENAPDGSGAVLGGRFYKAAPAGTAVEWIALRCTLGSNLALVRESLQTAAGIGELLIQTPRLKSLQRSLVCRISRVGVVRVYWEEISDEVIDAFLFELEALWGFLPQRTEGRGGS